MELGHFLAYPGRVRFAIAPLQVRDHALERLLHFIAAHAVIIDEIDFLIAGAVKDHLLDIFRQLVPLLLEVEAVMRRQGLQRLRLVGGCRLGPGRNGAVQQVQVLVGHDQVGVDLELVA